MGKLSPEKRIVFLGDGNNIANSWLELAERIPLHLVLSCPSGYEPHQQILEQAKAAKISTIEFVEDAREAVKGADVIYTDVWPESRGGIGKGRRATLFKSYQVNKSLLARAAKDVLFMHRLPANRGEEVTSEVLDGVRSIVLQQAENRLHVQKGIMGYILQRA
jgi:ornithine carbamoyltransferase